MADTLRAGVAADIAARVGVVRAYHDRTKHSFQRFAQGPGTLDWATQPDPFRRYAGAPVVELPRSIPAAPVVPAALDVHGIGECFRCAFGITAWKQAGASRWALRANPSSGNLHPTEAYLVAPVPGGTGCAVSHYAPRDHVLETRAVLPVAASPGGALAPPEGVCLVGLSSIHWREAWKYGERAFRYCQHDVGHAIGALVYSAARLGWRVRLLDGWGDADIAALLGLPDITTPDGGAEPESADCLMAVGPGDVDAANRMDVTVWREAARMASWQGLANQLSPSHREWPAIEEVVAATRHIVRPDNAGARDRGAWSAGHVALPAAEPVAREWLIRRRSAVAFDGQGMLSRAAFERMVARLQPGGPVPVGLEPSPVWSISSSEPQVRLVWFVHRVEGLAPGIYGQPRDRSEWQPMRGAMRDDLLWEPVDGIDGLFLLAPLDACALARRLSCDQAIASDGYFGMAMLAPLGAALDAHGPSVYRRLFWECGLVGQVLYLEAEMAGGRATGIGCFYDDPVHDMLGIEGHRLQSLYHFSMGVPIEDSRLTTAPGYDWD